MTPDRSPQLGSVLENHQSRQNISFVLFSFFRKFKSVAKPPNDRCIDSITLVEGVPVNGDNSDANYDYNNQGVCGARSDRRALWYEINGIGKEVTVNVCTNNDKST